MPTNPTQSLHSLLYSKFLSLHSNWRSYTNETYEEHINPDALNDLWLRPESNEGYIWNVGVLLVTDANKCDYATALIGFQRQPDREPEFIGELCFSQGENDDCGRVIKRACKLLAGMHPIFDDLDLEDDNAN